MTTTLVFLINVLDGINMLDEIFSEINKGVVPNKDVGRKLRNVN